MSTEEQNPTSSAYDEYEEYAAEIEAAEESQNNETEETATGDDNSTKEVDLRSVYVGNVDYHTTAEQLQEHFKSCGEMNKIYIPVDRITGQRKGFAYIEFADVSAVAEAIKLSDSTLNNRAIKVTAKRTNVFGFNRGRGGARGGARGGRGGRGGMMPNNKMMMQMMNAMQMAMRGGRGGARGGRGGRGGARGGRGGHGGQDGNAPGSTGSGVHSAPY